jgi:hypothetical protein
VIPPYFVLGGLYHPYPYATKPLEREGGRIEHIFFSDFKHKHKIIFYCNSSLKCS